MHHCVSCTVNVRCFDGCVNGRVAKIERINQKDVMARKKLLIARREVRLLSEQTPDIDAAIDHLQTAYPGLNFSDFARSIIWEAAKEIIGKPSRRPFVDAKVKRKARKDADSAPAYDGESPITKKSKTQTDLDD